MAECQSAGIRPVMVTGDHKATGLAIAQKLGIADAEGRAVDGHELESMSDQDLRADLDDIAVFARVHPAQKLRIVEAFQARGKVVAMTGDGVNDAPALARADVGVAMGITGTEVAKSAAKIVITDDNFSTIVKAVEEGRLVYSNLKKVILYLFATSMAEITVLLGALILGYPLPLAAVQILWINIVTEGTVTVNLVLEKPEGDEMRRPPVPQSESILDKALLKRVALMTPTMGLSTLAYFIWRLSEGVPYAQVQTETFTVLAACQWFNVLNCRSATLSALSLSIFNNRWLLGGLTLGIALQCLVVYAPALNQLFHTVPIEFGDFFLIVLTASTVLWVEEARKFVVRRTLRRRQSQSRSPRLNVPGSRRYRDGARDLAGLRVHQGNAELSETRKLENRFGPLLGCTKLDRRNATLASKWTMLWRESNASGGSRPQADGTRLADYNLSAIPAETGAVNSNPNLL